MQARKIKPSVIIAREERRKQIAQLLQQNNSETEIAQRLGVDLSTISRDIKALKEQATQFVYNLAKQDLAFFYHQTIADIDHVRGECWKLYNANTNSNNITELFNNDKKVTTKDRLLALKTILQADIARFELLSRGKLVMSVKALNERVNALKPGADQQVSAV